jgi:hypothetical protein
MMAADASLGGDRNPNGSQHSGPSFNLGATRVREASGNFAFTNKKWYLTNRI